MGARLLAVLLALSVAHNILQLTDEKVPLRLESGVSMELGAQQCLQPLSSYTLSGWFKADSSVPQQLFSVTTPNLSIAFGINTESELVVNIGILNQPTIPLQGRLEGNAWQHFTFSMSGQSQSATLSVRSEGGVEATFQTALPSTPSLDSTQACIALGDPSQSTTAEILDLTLVPISLSPTEARLMSPLPAVLPLSSQILSTQATLCQVEGLVAPQQKYNDEDLYSTWSWEYGISMFGWDYEDFGVNFSTVKVVFEMNDVMGDPDMEVYIYHLVASNEYLGESKKEGPDTLTFDWNTPRFKDGIDWDTTFRVYIEGKSWLNWYSLYCTIYSTSWARVSNGQSLGLHQTVQQRSNTASLVQSVALLGLVGLGVFLVYRQRSKRRASNTALLERLLVAN
jgi:hypothetical protein